MGPGPKPIYNTCHTQRKPLLLSLNSGDRSKVRSLTGCWQTTLLRRDTNNPRRNHKSTLLLRRATLPNPLLHFNCRSTSIYLQ
uniref:Uncharacterized protein n=1 Tax=Helianthus annuus TaxID=4232 RepID=A0A251SU46_HELAN